MGIADAVAREVAWLTTTGDGLPALQTAFGGPFEVLQGYWPRTAPTNKRALYVVRLSAVDQRTANIRSMVSHQFVLKLLWPMTLSNGSAEDAQAAFDAAVDQVLTRINGPLLDKTHGGRFLSVAETQGNVRVDWDDPEQALADGRVFRARIAYSADDVEINNSPLTTADGICRAAASPCLEAPCGSATHPATRSACRTSARTSRLAKRSITTN